MSAYESHSRLTSVTRGGGCACKLSAAELRGAIQGLMSHPTSRHPDLLVGFDTADDAEDDEMVSRLTVPDHLTGGGLIYPSRSSNEHL